jgi:hypothetical protein
MKKFLYLIFLSAQYTSIAEDFWYLIHYLADDQIPFGIISFSLIFLGVELLVAKPSLNRKINWNYTKKIQLLIHIILSINSLTWMIVEDIEFKNLLFGALMFILNIIIIQKFVHSFNRDYR